MMKRRLSREYWRMNKRAVMILLLLVFLTACHVYTLKVSAQETVVYVDPERTTGLNVGETFQVRIEVGNVTDLRGWEVKIFYKSSVLNASAITLPGTQACPFFNEEVPGASQVFAIHSFTDNFNATHGQIVAYCALPANVSVSGSGTLLWINFTAIGYGDSPIDIGPPWEFGTILFDINADPIEHSTIDGIVHVGLRDVSITNIEAPKSIPTNSIVKINVTAENQGEITENFDVTLYYDSNPIETKSILDMLGGGIEILTFTWDVTGLSIGEYTITATATQVQGEIDLDDNTLTFKLYVGIRDIAITTIIPSKTVANDTTVYIDVTIENLGEFEETFNVTMYYDTVTIETQAVENLTIGSTITLTFTWNTIVVSHGHYLITAVATTVPGEVNTDDILDIATVAQAYGTVAGDPRWNGNADLDNSNKVDIIDIATAAKNYGEEI